MTDDTASRIRAFFDERAAGWDASIPPETLVRLQEIVAALDLRPGDRVLDAGCGTGVLLPVLARRIGPGGLAVATDLAYRMLAEARAKTYAVPVGFLQADILVFPVAVPAFDWVICYNVFPHFEDPQGALEAFTRVLKPGGRLAVCHSRGRDDINALHQTTGGVVGGHMLPDADEMARLIAASGLDLVRIDEGADRYLALAAKGRV